MKIGLIGTGNMGQVLGRLWVQAGHQIIFGSRHPEREDLVTQLGKAASSQSVGRAIESADAVVIAVPFKAWPDLANQIETLVADKPVLDTTNFNLERDGVIAERARVHPKCTLGIVSELLPNAKLVKALNTMQAGFLEKKAGKGYAVPLAGDDPDAVSVARSLVIDAGFDPVIVGKGCRAKDFDNETQVWNKPIMADALRNKLGLN